MPFQSLADLATQRWNKESPPASNLSGTSQPLEKRKERFEALQRYSKSIHFEGDEEAMERELEVLKREYETRMALY
jgi:hypothetical protein